MVSCHVAVQFGSFSISTSITFILKRCLLVLLDFPITASCTDGFQKAQARSSAWRWTSTKHEKSSSSKLNFVVVAQCHYCYYQNPKAYTSGHSSLSATTSYLTFNTCAREWQISPWGTRFSLLPFDSYLSLPGRLFNVRAWKLLRKMLEISLGTTMDPVFTFYPCVMCTSDGASW